MKQMNELVDMKYLLRRLFIILHGWRNLLDFLVGFLWITLLFSMFDWKGNLLVAIDYGRQLCFLSVLWGYLMDYIRFLKNIF